MKIIKIINNNIVSSLDIDDREIVVMGRGIGFGKKAGQEIEEEKIEKIFRIEESQDLEQFKDLIKNIPLEYIQISNEIISYAKENLKIELSHNIYLTLTDHISFAIERMKEELLFSNALLSEIKRFYPEEYAIGVYGLNLIEARTGYKLPEDEAASIALHIVTAEFNIKVRDSYRVTELLQEMEEIIKQEFNLLSEDTLHKDKMIVDLKFLAYRLLMLPPQIVKEDSNFYDFIKNHCVREYNIADKIDKHAQLNYERKMTEEEKIYLSINIKRLKDVEETRKENK